MLKLKTLLAAGVTLALLGCSDVGAAPQSLTQSSNEAPTTRVTTMSLRQTVNQTEARKITDNIYMAEGFGNTFLVTTPAGNVIIDTSLASNAERHKELLDVVDSRTPDYIIITHAHGDHIGGVMTWKGEQTKVIQQNHAEEFLHYQERLKGFFQRRNAAQFGFDLADFEIAKPTTDNFAASIPADILFDDQHSFTLGGLTFDVIAMPGETHDALSVWMPEHKAVFVGDLYYESFPNLYTLRGTKPRWALDYVTSINKVLALEPEILIPSHGNPIYGHEEITKTLTHYRDAILYVHDATVAGMNAGKSVDELAATITLPDNLKVREIYGQVDWSVRGIHQGYAGWFDGNPSTMLGVNPDQSYGDIVQMAGGVNAVAAKAQSHLDEKHYDRALAMADIALSVDPKNSAALSVRRDVFQARLAVSENFNEAGWLKAGIREAEKTISTYK